MSELENLKKYLKWASEKAQELENYPTPCSSSAMIANQALDYIKQAQTVAVRITTDHYSALMKM